MKKTLVVNLFGSPGTGKSTLMAELYNKRRIFNDSLEQTVVAASRLYNNLNIFLNRTKPYNPNGREQTEEQSNGLAVTILDTIKEHEIPFVQLDANSETADIILQLIRDELAEKS